MKSIRKIVRNITVHWVGDGFPVHSLFSYADIQYYDPFLLLDYAEPHQFPPAAVKRGVGEHPHRGFETVTIVYQGELAHRDSSGSQGTIGAGDVQWMTAASGIVHEEFHSKAFTAAGGTLEMVQLWVNLPARDKTAPPGYQDILNASIPEVQLPGGAGSVRVIAGDFSGTKGPARTFTAVNLWDLQLAAGSSSELLVPSDHNALLIVQSGDVDVNGSAVKAVELVSFDRQPAQELIRLVTTGPARVLLLSGAPLNEPVVGQGPFVMNTREEIVTAIRDYQNGRMGSLGS